jgi:hypothetical protein
MDDYGISPVSMVRMLGPVFVIGPVVIWLLLSGPFVLYPLARWRQREAGADPQLGLKTAFHYFAMLAFQIGLFGAAIVLYTLFSKMGSSERGDAYRLGFGFIVPAVILFAFHAGLLKRTNMGHFPIVSRLFLGYNLVITGLLGLVAFVMVFQALFTKGSSGDFGRFAGAALIVYGGAWATCGIRFGKLVLVDGDAAAPAPHVPRESRAPTEPPAPPTPSGPQLPSLGGGSFPPIDKK